MLSGKDPPTTIVISANAAKLTADSKKKGFKVDLTTDMPQQGRNLACPKKLNLTDLSTRSCDKYYVAGVW